MIINVFLGDPNITINVYYIHKFYLIKLKQIAVNHVLSV